MGWIFGGERRAPATFLVERREASDGRREQPGASVAMVAQRNGVNANLLFTWRRAAASNGGAEPVKLVPVTVAEAEAPSATSLAAPEPIGRMEIVLSGGSGSSSAWTSTRRRWRAWSER